MTGCRGPRSRLSPAGDDVDVLADDQHSGPPFASEEDPIDERPETLVHLVVRGASTTGLPSASSRAMVSSDGNVASRFRPRSRTVRSSSGVTGPVGAIDDEIVRADLGLELVDQVDDAAGGRQPPDRRVAHHEQHVDVARRAPAQVLEPGFVVDDHDVVARRDAVDDRAQHVVGRAVAARPLGAPHGQQIDALAFDDAGVDLVVEQVVLGDAGLEAPVRALSLVSSRMSPTVRSSGSPRTVFRLLAGSASMARMGPRPSSLRSLMSSPASVVLPVPPFPAMAIVIVMSLLLVSPEVAMSARRRRRRPATAGSHGRTGRFLVTAAGAVVGGRPPAAGLGRRRIVGRGRRRRPDSSVTREQGAHRGKAARSVCGRKSAEVYSSMNELSAESSR